MHKAIFVLVGLLVLGCVSVVKCYSYQSERDFEAPLYRRTATEDEECEESGEVHSAGASCPKCKPGQICTPPNLCRCPVGPVDAPCQIQSAGSCSSAATKYSPSVKSIDFGSGSSQYSSATPAKLGFRTNYKQVFSSKEKVNDGSFAIVNKLPQDWGTWLGGGPSDHTGGGNGYMLLVNAAYGKGTLMTIKVNDLIVGLRYEFSAYFANINKKGSNLILPDIYLEARTATSDNTLIASTPTGKLPEQSSLTWERHGMSFITPSESVVLSIVSKGGGGNGDDYVVDDILLVPCQPVDNVVCSK